MARPELGRAGRAAPRGCGKAETPVDKPRAAWYIAAPIAESRGRLAQLVEQLTLNQRVIGSSPIAPTIPATDIPKTTDESDPRPVGPGAPSTFAQFAAATSAAQRARKAVRWAAASSSFVAKTLTFDISGNCTYLPTSMSERVGRRNAVSSSAV